MTHKQGTGRSADRVCDLPTRHYEAAGGVVIHEGKVLLVRRRHSAEVRLPKGHVEPGELPSETAIREVGEETGYRDLEILQTLGSKRVCFVLNGELVIRDQVFYLMELGEDHTPLQRPEDAEVFEPLWAPLDEAEQMLTFPEEQAVLHQARQAYR
jgi:8-oxo-dGTP pyrophosphatase MutT (NUDIX family)